MASPAASRAAREIYIDLDLGRIVYVFRQDCGEPAPARSNEAHHAMWAYRNISGFCKAETIKGVDTRGLMLTRSKHVDAEETDDDGEPFAEKYPCLMADLKELTENWERDADD